MSGNSLPVRKVQARYCIISKGNFFRSVPIENMKTGVGSAILLTSGFLSSRPNWVPTLPHPQESVASPPVCPRGEGVGGPNSDDGTDALVL